MPLDFIYDRLLLPIGEALLWAVSPLDSKAKEAVRGRSHWADKLREKMEDAPDGPRIMLHAPSVGEFLQGRAVLDKILDARPDFVPVVTHFSPSAKKIVSSYTRARATGYLPLDTKRNGKKLLDIVKPKMIVFARADVWPNLAEEAALRKIPTALIAGSVSEPGGKISQAASKMASRRFRSLKFVGAVSDEDAARFREIGVDPKVIVVTGDPRYDQTWDRAQAVDPNDEALRGFPRDGWTFVAGSSWPADEKVVVPAFADARRKHPKMRLVIAPHEPTSTHIEALKKLLASHGLESVTLTEAENGATAPVVIVDRVGILAKIYSLGKAAFVGGSFVRRVHNVMEPACFSLPVIVGPKHKNSHEAGMMIKAGGCLAVDSKTAMTDMLLKFIEDENARLAYGEKARKLVESQRGASSRTFAAMRERFPEILG